MSSLMGNWSAPGVSPSAPPVTSCGDAEEGQDGRRRLSSTLGMWGWMTAPWLCFLGKGLPERTFKSGCHSAEEFRADRNSMSGKGVSQPARNDTIYNWRQQQLTRRIIWETFFWFRFERRGEGRIRREQSSPWEHATSKSN